MDSSKLFGKVTEKDQILLESLTLSALKNIQKVMCNGDFSHWESPQTAIAMAVFQRVARMSTGEHVRTIHDQTDACITHPVTYDRKSTSIARLTIGAADKENGLKVQTKLIVMGTEDVKRGRVAEIKRLLALGFKSSFKFKGDTIIYMKPTDVKSRSSTTYMNSRYHDMLSATFLPMLRESPRVVDMRTALKFLYNLTDDILIQTWLAVQQYGPTNITYKKKRVGKLTGFFPDKISCAIPKATSDLDALKRLFDKSAAPVRAVGVGLGATARAHDMGIFFSKSTTKDWIHYQDYINYGYSIVVLVGCSAITALGLLNEAIVNERKVMFIRKTDTVSHTDCDDFVSYDSDGEITSVNCACLISGGEMPSTELPVRVYSVIRPDYISSSAEEYRYKEAKNRANIQFRDYDKSFHFYDNYQRYVMYMDLSDDKLYLPSFYAHSGYAIETTDSKSGLSASQMLRYMIGSARKAVNYAYHGNMTTALKIDAVSVTKAIRGWNFAKVSKEVSTDLDEDIYDVDADKELEILLDQAGKPATRSASKEVSTAEDVGYDELSEESCGELSDDECQVEKVGGD